MRSKQINFYLFPNQLVDFETYLKENEWLIANSKSVNQSFHYTGLIETNGLKYIFKQADIDKIRMDFIENQNYFVINSSLSNVIEFLPPKYDTIANNIRKGRIYYEPYSYTKGQTDKLKDEHFIETAENLFSWFKKHYEWTKQPEHKGFYISKDVANMNLKILTI